MLAGLSPSEAQKITPVKAKPVTPAVITPVTPAATKPATPAAPATPGAPGTPAPGAPAPGAPATPGAKPPEKKPKGRRRKEKAVAPPGFNMDMVARDWGNWKHGEKFDVSLPSNWDLEKPETLPDWLQEIIKSSKNGKFAKSPDLSTLDPEKHGLKYIWSRMRKENILMDNKLRAAGKWSYVTTLRTNRKHRGPQMAH